MLLLATNSVPWCVEPIQNADRKEGKRRIPALAVRIKLKNARVSLR